MTNSDVIRSLVVPLSFVASRALSVAEKRGDKVTLKLQEAKPKTVKAGERWAEAFIFEGKSEGFENVVKEKAGYKGLERKIFVSENIVWLESVKKNEVQNEEQNEEQDENEDEGQEEVAEEKPKRGRKKAAPKADAE